MALTDAAGTGRWLAAARSAASRLARRDVGELVAISAEALSRYKLRTALSVLGVVLGVAAVIAMMSVSEGARRDALQQMELLGLDNVVVRNGAVTLQQLQKGRWGVTTGDAARLRELVPLVATVAPLTERFQSVSTSGVRKRTTRVLGAVAEYQAVLRLQLGRGRFLSAVDMRNQAPVCVLGATLARALFGYRDPMGQSVQIEGHWYSVVGILGDRATDTRGIGAMAARDLNQAVLVPLSTSLGRSLDLDPEQKVDEVWIQLTSGDRVSEIGRIVESTMKQIHRGIVDFEVVVPRELLQQRYRTQRTFSVVVGSVAVLSLLVGGIGIMNIMLASVLERTHEIGIRRTVGATRRDVTLQFLTEALLMTLSGGGVGIVTGAVVSWGITAYAGWSTRLSPSAVLLAFSVSFLVGLAFGIYPARKAAELQPIDAIRYE